MPLHRLDEHQPQCHESVWIAPSAQVIGQVTIGPQCSVWFNAVMTPPLGLSTVYVRSRT
ncbi:MAG: hypothetical protein EBX53_12345 [Betaproteobacteria bacterium]|nr:hypothetical protein [Betaproteobacteria bacterium]